jgi:hypothetical protein
LSFGRGGRLGAVLLFSLLAVTLALAVLVVRARTPDLVLEVTGWKPCDRELNRDAQGAGLVQVSFFVRESDDHARIRIVNKHERTVRILDADRRLHADEEVRFRWDGTDNAGHPVKPGLYRLGVTLPDHDREMVWPRRIGVETAQLPDPSCRGPF